MKPKGEGTYCFLQGRNIFFEEKVMYPHCKAAENTIDYLTTICDRMLDYYYTR